MGAMIIIIIIINSSSIVTIVTVPMMWLRGMGEQGAPARPIPASSVSSQGPPKTTGLT